MHILVYSMDTKVTRRKAAVHYAVHSLSRWNLIKSYADLCRSFTFVCQLYCCSSKYNNNKALRITCNSCKTVSTYSMALATVNVDKIIKVTSASSYVYIYRVYRSSQKKVICKFKLWTAAILNLCKLTTFPVSKSWRLFICSSEGPNKQVKAKKPSIAICSRSSPTLTGLHCQFWRWFLGWRGLNKRENDTD